MSQCLHDHRARYLLACALLALWAVACGLEEPATPDGGAWTIIVVPDTQHYVNKTANVQYLMTKMEWIASNIESRNVALVTQLGDVVQHGSRTVQWDRAEDALGLIHGLVPYSVSIGDHDYVREEDRASGAPEYLRRFGASRYADMPWYGGSSPDQKSHYQIFTAGNRRFLHLNLEWEVPGAPDDPQTAMGWARSILDANPTTPTIISTHSYVWDKPREQGRTNGVEEVNGDGHSGEAIWSELIRNRPQVFMVLNGNFHRASTQYDPTQPDADPHGPSEDGEYHQVSTNLFGLPVYEMLSNYQDYPRGGDGWIRIIRFEEGGGESGLDRISVRTYSPVHDAYQLDELSHFHFDLRFDERFDELPAPLPLQRVIVTSGADTYIWRKNASRNYGSSDTIRINSDDDGPQQGLIRFDIPFGTEIPRDAHIVSAQVHIHITSSGDGFSLHRMLEPWDEDTATWDSMNSGVITDGVQAARKATMQSKPYLTRSKNPYRSIFDATGSALLWHDGEDNHGWAIVPLGTKRLAFRSFENKLLQPRLVIDYVVPERLALTP